MHESLHQPGCGDFVFDFSEPRERAAQHLFVAHRPRSGASTGEQGWQSALLSLLPRATATGTARARVRAKLLKEHEHPKERRHLRRSRHVANLGSRATFGTSVVRAAFAWTTNDAYLFSVLPRHAATPTRAICAFRSWLCRAWLLITSWRRTG